VTILTTVHLNAPYLILIGDLEDPSYAKTGILCVGISVNTSELPPGEREVYLANLSEETGLPCVDPLIDGCGAIIEHIKQLYPEV